MRARIIDACGIPSSFTFRTRLHLSPVELEFGDTPFFVLEQDTLVAEQMSINQSFTILNFIFLPK